MGQDTNNAAADLMELAVTDPHGAVTEATRRLRTAPSVGRAEILRGRGVAQRRLGDLAASRTDLESALELVDVQEAPNSWAPCALSLGATVFLQGDLDEGLSFMKTAVEVSSGEVYAEAAVQLASAHAMAGDMASAEATYTAVLPSVRSHAMRAVEGQLLANRAIARDYQGNLSQSLDDSAAADLIYRERDEWTNAAQNMANRAGTFLRLGEIPASLESSLEADKLIARTAVDPATYGRAKCETLMAAGLFSEALATAKEAAEFHRSSQERLAQVEALTLASEAALALGEWELAANLAKSTSEVKGVDAMSAMHARAKLVTLRLQGSHGEMSPDAVDTALDLATDIRKSGRPGGATEATLEAARIALANGDRASADELLTACAQPSRRAPLPVRAQRWELVARVRGAAGDDRGMLRAIDAGLRAIEQLSESVGSFELRARAAIHGRDLEATATRILLRRGDAVRLAEIVMRRRGAMLNLSPAPQPESSGRLDTELALLREAETRHRQAGNDDTWLALTAARRSLTEQSRTAAAPNGPPKASLSTKKSDASPRLEPGESMLVLAETDDELVAVHQTSRGAQLSSCGPAADIVGLVQESAYLARQLSRAPRLSATVRKHLQHQHRSVSAELADRILPDGLEQRVIISAPANLLQLTWGALPGLYERPHCLTPSRRLAPNGRQTPHGSVFVAGADALAHVPDEVAAIAAVHDVERHINPGFSDIVGAAGSTLWHLAGHFIANGDNPLFSSVELGEFDLHAHHVLGSGLAPEVAVLSACNTAHGEDTGSGQLGFAHALLSAGTRTVITTASLLEDGPATVQTMTELHQQLNDNVPAADALANLRVSSGDDDRAGRVGLTVLGVGWPAGNVQQ